MHRFKLCLCLLSHSLTVIDGDTSVGMYNIERVVNRLVSVPDIWRLLYTPHWSLYSSTRCHPFLCYWYEETSLCMLIITSKYPLLRNSLPRTIILLNKQTNNFHRFPQFDQCNQSALDYFENSGHKHHNEIDSNQSVMQLMISSSCITCSSHIPGLLPHRL